MKTKFSLRKSMIVALLFICFFFNVDKINAQENTTTNNFIELQQTTAGLFQIQMIGIRTQPSISNDLLELVLSNQQQSTRAHFQYKENIRLEILSKDEVLNGTKFSEEEKIIYINIDQNN